MLRRLIISALALSVCSNVIAEDNPISASASVGFYTDYMWRGFQLYDGASIQPALNMGYDMGEMGSLSAGAWSHISAEGSDNRGSNFQEIDYTVAYKLPVDFMSLSVGHIWYTFPYDPSDLTTETAEYFASAGFDTILNPTLTVYSDYDEFDNEYYELGISQPVLENALGDGFNMTPYTTFGFGSNSEKVYADDGLEQVTFGVNFDTKLGDIAVRPGVHYTAGVDDATADEFWSGVNFGYDF